MNLSSDAKIFLTLGLAVLLAPLLFTTTLYVNRAYNCLLWGKRSVFFECRTDEQIAKERLKNPTIVDLTDMVSLRSKIIREQDQEIERLKTEKEQDQ